MAALSRGERSLEVHKSKDHVDMSLYVHSANDEDNAAFFKQMLHKTTIQYNLLGEDTVKRFMSLDETRHVEAVPEIDHTSLKHCLRGN